MMHSKSIMVYGIIAILIIVIMSAAYITLVRSPSNNKPIIHSTAQLVANSNASSVAQFKNQFCGLTSMPSSNNYVTEYNLPHTCEMPLGVAVDSQSGKVWYVSTKQGTLGSYDLVSKKFDKEIAIPIWKVRQNLIDFSDVWSLKVSSKGDSIWFTDEKQNAIWRYSKSLGGFEMYKIPEMSGAFGTIYPVSIDFDSKGNAVVWNHYTVE